MAGNSTKGSTRAHNKDFCQTSLVFFVYAYHIASQQVPLTTMTLKQLHNSLRISAVYQEYGGLQRAVRSLQSASTFTHHHCSCKVNLPTCHSNQSKSP